MIIVVVIGCEVYIHLSINFFAKFGITPILRFLYNPKFSEKIL